MESWTTKSATDDVTTFSTYVVLIVEIPGNMLQRSERMVVLLGKFHQKGREPKSPSIGWVNKVQIIATASLL